FAGKPDLLLAVVAEALERSPAFEAAADHSGERISEVVGFYVSRELEEVRGIGREVHAAARREERVRALLAKYNGRVRKATVARIRAMRGARPAGSPELAADVLLALVLGLAHLDTLFPERAGDPGFRAAVEEAVERILGARRPR
ncbi:MAG: TetR family transcriptional regulator C-terminal domain-containing protein, partial [Candidatus Binatia bacterium]